jgi:hypothetical protein
VDFYEVGGLKPTNIIRCDQPAVVKVTIDFTGKELARLLCVDWCIKVAFDSCGPGPEEALPTQTIHHHVCECPYVVAEFKIPPRYFPCDAAACGSVFELCVTVISLDGCGTPAPIAGYCRGGTIMVFPAP